MRIFPLLIGIIAIVLSYLLGTEGHHAIPLIGYVVGFVLVIIGLVMPSRRQMWQRFRQRRMGNNRAGNST